MAGSLAEAFGPCCLRFFRPMRVVGAGGGSYFGLSFYITRWSDMQMTMLGQQGLIPSHLFYLCCSPREAPGRPCQTGWHPVNRQLRSVNS